MPYRHAHWWVLGLLPLTALAFWPNYLASFSTAPSAFHIHGATATAWLLLLAFQSWSIHTGHRAWHRAAGMSSLAVFPSFLAGGLLVLHSMAAKSLPGVSRFYEVFGARLATLDIVSVVGTAYLFHIALRHRRNIRVHAAAMLGTVAFLLPPVLGRLAPFLPPLAINGPADLHRFAYGVQLAQALVLLGAWWLYRRDRRSAWPFAFVAATMAVQSVLFETLGRSDGWIRLFRSLADVPAMPIALLGFALGMASAWSGWAGSGSASSTLRKHVATRDMAS